MRLTPTRHMAEDLNACPEQLYRCAFTYPEQVEENPALPLVALEDPYGYQRIVAQMLLSQLSVDRLQSYDPYHVAKWSLRLVLENLDWEDLRNNPDADWEYWLSLAACAQKGDLLPELPRVVCAYLGGNAPEVSCAHVLRALWQALHSPFDDMIPPAPHRLKVYVYDWALKALHSLPLFDKGILAEKIAFWRRAKEMLFSSCLPDKGMHTEFSNHVWRAAMNSRW